MNELNEYQYVGKPRTRLKAWQLFLAISLCGGTWICSAVVTIATLIERTYGIHPTMELNAIVISILFVGSSMVMFMVTLASGYLPKDLRDVEVCQ
jgi:hypothetical protein